MAHGSEASHHPDSDIEAKNTRGLYEGFDAYRTPTEDDYRQIFQEGIIIPDANVLLNLYRYSEQARDDLLAVLDEVGDRLWVPHQVLVEFWRNRDSVLRDPRDTDRTVKFLTEQLENTVTRLNSWINRVGLPRDQKDTYDRILTEAFESIIEDIKEFSDGDAAESARDTSKDRVLVRLEQVLKGRVGAKLAEDAYQEALKEAKRRAEAKIPPGYRDAVKGGEHAAGDYLVWVQVLEEVRREPRDVLIVTGDVKEDWWRREGGELRGPHPYLADEVRELTGVRLFMIRPESLLVLAEKILSIHVQDESVEDIGRVKEYEWGEGMHEFPTIADVRRDWGVILDQIKSQRRVAWMLLLNSEPVSLDNWNLTISFPRMGDVKGFSAGKYDQMLSAVLADMYELEIDVVAVVGDEGHRSEISRLRAELAAEYPDEPPF